MNYLDIILVILLLIGIIRGFVKGFVYEVAVFGALFLGVYAAFKLAYLITPWLSKTTGASADSMGYVSSLAMFLLVVTGIILLAKLFTGLADMAALGIFNKIAGGVFGLIKHALLLSIVIYFFNQLDVKQHYLNPDKKAESLVYYPLMKIAPGVLPVMKELKIELIEEIADTEKKRKTE